MDKKIRKRSLRRDQKDADRYRFWRDNEGICVGDAPLAYLDGKELDDYTDKLIKKEKASGTG